MTSFLFFSLVCLVIVSSPIFFPLLSLSLLHRLSSFFCCFYICINHDDNELNNNNNNNNNGSSLQLVSIHSLSNACLFVINLKKATSGSLFASSSSYQSAANEYLEQKENKDKNRQKYRKDKTKEEKKRRIT